jgi:hypothetical protein
MDRTKIRFQQIAPDETTSASNGLPIKYWSHSSLMSYLRNPLAWYKRYVEKVYDIPSTPSAIVGRAAHVALQHFYGGIDKEGAIELGLENLRNCPDFDINFGRTVKTKLAKKQARLRMERQYKQAVGYYLAKPPKHKVVGIEVSNIAKVQGLALPVKAISDLVVESRVQKGALDIVDHKFVDSFSSHKQHKTLFVMQALFNYYTVTQKYGQPVKRFIVIECKKTQNVDGSPQLKRYVIEYDKCSAESTVFHRLINDATEDLRSRKVFLPNPSDMFEGENSFDIYRLGLGE